MNVVEMFENFFLKKISCLFEITVEYCQKSLLHFEVFPKVVRQQFVGEVDR